MRHRLAAMMLTCWLCVLPSFSHADSINTITGEAARGTDLSWKHLRAYRMDLQAGTGQPIGTGDFALATYAMSGACLNATCSQFIPSLSTDKTVATSFASAGNNLPSYIGLNYMWNQTGANDTTGAFNRIIGGYTDLTALGFQASGLARTPNVLNTIASGIVIRDAILDSVSSVSPAGTASFTPYLLTGSTTLNREWGAHAFPAEGGTCLGCPLAAKLTFCQGCGGGVSGWVRERGNVSPVQGGSALGTTLFTSQTVSAANTAVAVTIAASTQERGHIYKLLARCSAGTSNLTITDGGTTVYTTAAAEVGVVNYREEWGTGLTGSVNSAVVATLAACGAGNTGTLMMQGDRF